MKKLLFILLVVLTSCSHETFCSFAEITKYDWSSPDDTGGVDFMSFVDHQYTWRKYTNTGSEQVNYSYDKIIMDGRNILLISKKDSILAGTLPENFSWNCNSIEILDPDQTVKFTLKILR